MSNRCLLVWLCITIIGSTLCQNYKISLVTIISIAATSVSAICFFVRRVKDYHTTHVLHYKLMIVYEVFAVLVVSCSLLLIGIFCLNKDDGVWYLLYLFHSIPLIPIIINTAWVNAKSNM